MLYNWLLMVYNGQRDFCSGLGTWQCRKARAGDASLVVVQILGQISVPSLNACSMVDTFRSEHA